jgi:hypothetical protein
LTPLEKDSVLSAVSYCWDILLLLFRIVTIAERQEVFSADVMLME